MNQRITTFSVILLACGLSACDVSDYLTTAETDQVLTIKAPEQDYTELRTYILPTEVVDLCQTDDEGGSGIGNGDGVENGQGGMGGRPEFDDSNCIEVEHRYDDVAIQAIRENMDNLGYREITDPTIETPDVAFLMGWVARNNWYIATYYPYCGGYSYYYYGCWYGSASYAYNMPTGALVVSMAVVDKSAAGEFTSAWTLAFQGLLEQSSEISTPRRIERGVNQGFLQSPYLADGGEN